MRHLIVSALESFLEFIYLLAKKYEVNVLTQEINYVVWKEEKQFVSRCLNVEVSSFGETVDEAIKNLKEAVELYFEGEQKQLIPINNIMLGRDVINA